MESVPGPRWKEDKEIMVLKVKPDDFEAIQSERKRWEARPLVEHRKGGGKGNPFAPWKYLHLATEGRGVKVQRYYERGLSLSLIHI